MIGVPPLISVLTICKNASSTIERTLRSITHCGYPRLQLVVVDGASTDGTLDVIHRYGSQIDRLVSEPDRGIAEALNKAVTLSDGDYHIIVHADDELLHGSLSRLALYLTGGSPKVVCGSVLVIGRRGVVRRFRADPALLMEKMSIPHMGCLIQKAAWASVGGYDMRREVAMDHLLLLRILKQFGLESFVVTSDVVANYYLGGVSDKRMRAGFREVRDNLREEGAGSLRANAAYLKLVSKASLARVLRRY